MVKQEGSFMILQLFADSLFGLCSSTGLAYPTATSCEHKTDGQFVSNSIHEVHLSS